MAGGAFVAGAIASKMLLDLTSWNASVQKVKQDSQEGTERAKGWNARIQEMEGGFRRAGQAMTVAGTAILGTVGLMVNKAADAQETFSKFQTVFKDVSTSANAAAKQLAKSYGLSDVAAQRMLSSTGDLLTGLGMQSEAALDLSTKTQQLAVDLASFTNFQGGATGAADALTKAMLGERESLKSLGIVITEEMVKEKLLAAGKADLTGLALNQAKAEATLEIAMSQSKNAIGDYARTSDSLVNQKRLLAAQVENLTVTLGSKLIPIATQITSKIAELVGKVIQWTNENPGLTDTIMKVVAAGGAILLTVGPLVASFPKIIRGIQGIGAAFKFLAANPAVLLIAALGAIVVGFMKVKAAQAEAEKSTRLYEETAARFDKKLLGIAERAGLTADEFENLKQKYDGNTNAMVKAIRAGKEGVALQESMLETGEKNVALQEEQREEMEFTLPVLENYLKGTEAIGTATETTAEKQKTWIDYLKNQGIMTVKEKGDRVDELERFVRELNDAYRDGKIDVKDWEAATKSAKDEIVALTETVGITVQNVGRDMSDVFGQAVDAAGLKVHELPPEVEKAGQLIVGKKDSIWNKMSDGIKTQWTNMWSDMFKARSWDDVVGALKTFGENVLTQISDIAANAFAKWTTGFIDKMITGTASMATDVVGSVKDVGKGVLDIAAGFSPGGMIATTFATAIGTFLGSIIGPKGAGQRDTQLIKDNTWTTAQHAANLVTNADAIKWSMWNIEPMVNDIKLNGWSIYETLKTVPNQLKDIAVNTNAMVKLLRSKKGAQHGAVVTEPDFVFVHGSKRAPEYIIPADMAPRGGRGGGDVNVTINLNNPIMTRDYTRNEIIPEMINAFKSQVHKSKIQQSLGIA